MKHKMMVTLHAQPNIYEECGFSYHVYGFDDMSTSGYVACDTVEVVFDLPPRDVLVKGVVEAFRKEQERIKAETQVKVNNIEEQIQKLLAIEYKPEA